MKYKNIREIEELKIRVAKDIFGNYDCSNIIKDIDFSVRISFYDKAITPKYKKWLLEDSYFLWAEAKIEIEDIVAMLTQLMFTIVKARPFDKIMPPLFLGCFDCEKIAFVPYSEIQDIYFSNKDINWDVAPPHRETREFLYKKILKETSWNSYIFDFEKDDKELRKFLLEIFVEMCEGIII